MERIARAKQNSVLELYFASSRNTNDPGPLEMPSARKCARFAKDTEASSSGSKVSSNPCNTPPRANAAVKLICPGGLPEPAISSIGSDVVEIIDVTSDAPVATPCKAKKKQMRYPESVRMHGPSPILGLKCFEVVMELWIE
jgi:hypothetical protein